MKTLLEGLGLATICLGWILVPVLDPRHISLYHWYGSATLFYLPPLLDVCLLWLFLSLCILAASRIEVWRNVFWSAVVAFSPAILLKALSLAQFVTPSRLRGISLLLFGVMLFCTLLYLWIGKKINPTSVIEVASVAAMLIGCSGVLFLTQTGWYWLRAGALNAPFVAKAPARQMQPGGPRIVWIVFDELSFQQVYGRRFPGLSLPAFDSLAQQSTVFSNVVPAGIMTQKVLPALMTGEPVDEIRSNVSGELLTHSPTRAGWARFDPHDTVFADAQNLGYTTSVVGWFNPYCRILQPVLNNCFWIFDDQSSGASFTSNVAHKMASPFLKVLATDFRGTSAKGLALNAGPDNFQRDFAQITARTAPFVEQKGMAFTFLHLPVPHPPGMYDRRTRSFAGGTSYIDNLALADECLSAVITELKQSGEWDGSTLVVMGDHSWRTTTSWRNSPWWTPEDELASQGGTFDPRPAYIVKLPGQRDGFRIDSPYQATQTRKLLDGIMSNKLQTEQQLAEWVRTTP